MRVGARHASVPGADVTWVADMMTWVADMRPGALLAYVDGEVRPELVRLGLANVRLREQLSTKDGMRSALQRDVAMLEAELVEMQSKATGRRAAVPGG